MFQKVNINKQQILLIICAIIFLLGSFRGGSADDDALGYFVPSYIALLQRLSLPLVGLLMFVSILVNINRADKKEHPGVPIGLICYFVFQLIIVLTSYFYRSDFQDLLVRGSFVALTFVYFFKVIRSLPLYESLRDGVLIYFFYGLLAFIAVNVFVYLSPSANVFWKGRLYGVTSHPNFLGMCASICWITSIALFLRANAFKAKVFFLLAVFLSIYCCILTGSRTSVLSGTLGTVCILAYTLQNNSFKPILILCMILFGLFLYANLTLQSLDFEGRGNTREGTWASMLERASELPLFGYGRVGATTNAYLYSIVATGIFGSIFFFRSLIELMRLYFSNLPQFDKSTVNLFRGLVTFFLVSSTFEGYLLDNVSTPVFTYWLLLTYVKF